jgi:squalene synthase HpnC
MVAAHVRALIELPTVSPSTAEADRFCLALARSHYENFTVLSHLAPREMRRHLAALYAYCRTVDDLGDEAPGDRLALLDRFESELDAAFASQARHPVLVALQGTIARLDLPREPFARLIEANRIDQRSAPFETFADVLTYCEHSANPVGRLVLMLYGYRDEERFARSDDTCTALQLANFWQDVRRDAEAGRMYLPVDEMDAYGVSTADLRADRASASLKDLMRFQVDRARSYFRRGLPLLDTVRGHLRVDLALFSLGGLAILRKIEQLDYDTLSRRPTLSGPEKIALALSALVSKRWRRI